MKASALPGVDRGLKTCNFLSNILIREISIRKGTMEGVIIDPVRGVTEGATSNIFIVINGVLITPAINDCVLKGITRGAVIEIAREHKVPVEERVLLPEDVLTADEVFITNSGIDIVPVIRVEDTYIGNKKPGILTRFLQEEFFGRQFQLGDAVANTAGIAAALAILYVVERYGAHPKSK